MQPYHSGVNYLSVIIAKARMQSSLTRQSTVGGGADQRPVNGVFFLRRSFRHHYISTHMSYIFSLHLIKSSSFTDFTNYRVIQNKSAHILESASVKMKGRGYMVFTL